MTKKILAGVLAAASILSVSAVASAAGDPTPSPYGKDVSTTTVSAPGQTSYKVNAGLLECTLDVVIPTTIKAYLNPYDSSVQIADSAGAATAGDKIKTGVTSYAYIVQNKGTCDVGIDIVGGAAEGKGDVELYSKTDYTTVAAFTDTTTDAEKAKYAGKKAFVAMVGAAPGEVATAIASGAAPGWASTQQKAAVTAAANVPTTDVPDDKTGKGAFFFTEDEKSLENFIQLEAPSDGKVRIAAFTFNGLVTNFKDASGEKEDWTNKDGLAINFAFKVHP